MKIFISQPMGIVSVRRQIIEKLTQKYGDDVVIINSCIKDAPPVDKPPLWYLGESLKTMSQADIVVFAYNTPGIGGKTALARGYDIQEKCAKKYDVLCLYVPFFEDGETGYIGDLSVKRPDFVE